MVFFPHLNLLKYYFFMPMEKKGQYVCHSAISQVGRTCSAPWFGHQRLKRVPGTSVVAWGAIAL